MELNGGNVFDLLKVCSSTKDIARGRMIHKTLSESGGDLDNYIANSLIHMYAKCGQMLEANNVFDKMQRHDVVSWNILISGYAENGNGLVAFSLFLNMQDAHEVAPTALTFVAALKACIALKSEECRERGMIVHSYALKRNLVFDIRVSSTLVDMYTKCGSLRDAQKVFDAMRQHDVVSWNTLIFGHAANGESETSLHLFWDMHREGCAPNALTFVAALKACSRLRVGVLDNGLVIHSLAAIRGYTSDVRVANTLVDMYAKCGRLQDAHRVFQQIEHRTLVSWTVLISGYVENGDGATALELFSRMKCEGFVPDAPTFVAVLKACSCLAAKEEAQKIEGKFIKLSSLQRGVVLNSQIVSSCCRSDICVASSLIDMYAKCGSMDEAQKVFDKIIRQDVVSWTALILGYAENGQGRKALEVYSHMSCAPDALTFLAVLKACTILGALDVGRRLHVEICHRGFQEDDVLVTSLIDFYGKCGSMVEAQHAFDCLPTTKNVVTWTALMSGYSQNGDVDSVFYLYQRMLDAGLRPCGVTFLCILTACSHAGLVQKGKEYFELMCSKYQLNPDIEHYHCMLNILGRANELNDAVALVKRMPFKPNAVTWTIVLSACRKWKNVEMGRVAFEALLEIDDDHAGAACVLMANIFGTKGAAHHMLGVDIT